VYILRAVTTSVFYRHILVDIKSASVTARSISRNQVTVVSSHKVTLEEIKNDFNLNISRYISTAKPEELIDLNAVNSELKKLQEKIEKFRTEHNAYLKELGIELLA